MFTGIVKSIGKITKKICRPGLTTYSITADGAFFSEVEIGASVAVDGVCLTVVDYQRNTASSTNKSLSNSTNIERTVTFDLMQETLQRTTLGSLKEGDNVNLERAAHQGIEIGGHLISGHVDCLAEVIAIDRPENNYSITFRIPKTWTKYLFQMGYVAINGTSLTIFALNRKENTFVVSLIPETLRMTTFAAKKIGDLVNIEIERGTQVIVDTVMGFLEEKFGEIAPTDELNKNRLATL